MLAFEETPKNNKIINVDDSGAEKRVRVEDKKVINGKADVNQLVHLNIIGLGINILLDVLTTGCLKK